MKFDHVIIIKSLYFDPTFRKIPYSMIYSVYGTCRKRKWRQQTSIAAFFKQPEKNELEDSPGELPAEEEKNKSRHDEDSPSSMGEGLGHNVTNIRPSHEQALFIGACVGQGRFETWKANHVWLQTNGSGLVNCSMYCVMSRCPGVFSSLPSRPFLINGF